MMNEEGGSNEGVMRNREGLTGCLWVFYQLVHDAGQVCS